jgi:hypothetical protein
MLLQSIDLQSGAPIVGVSLDKDAAMERAIVEIN